MNENSIKAPESFLLDNTPATNRFLICLFLLLALFQVCVYGETFNVKPSGDDFIAPLAEIHRGGIDGPISFFLEFKQADYRPLQSFVMWIFGTISSENPLIWVHILHFLSAWFFAFITFLWIKHLKFSRINAIVAAAIIFLHPVLAGNLASIDSFGRFVVSGWIWLGAYVAHRFTNDNFLKAYLLCVLCFIIGLGFMEYALGLIPLAGYVIFTRSDKFKIRNTLLIVISLLFLFFVYFLIRYLLVVSGRPGVAFISRESAVWFTNLVMLFSGALYFGNTVEFIVERSIKICAWFGINLAAVMALLLWGILKKNKSDSIISSTSNPGFLIIIFILSCFPMVVMRHVTELYVCMMVIPFALLMGHLSSNWMRTSYILRIIILLVLLFEIAIGTSTIRSKVSDLRILGERTDAQITRILNHVPYDVHEWHIGLVFIESEESDAPTYSIFREKDSNLILKLARNWFVMDWYRQGSNHSLEYLIVNDISEVEFDNYDLVLNWDYSTKTFNSINQ